MSTYGDLNAYNAGVYAARAAYYADQAVRAGYCAVCQERKHDKRHRRCWACEREHQPERAA